MDVEEAALLHASTHGPLKRRWEAHEKEARVVDVIPGVYVHRANVTSRGCSRSRDALTSEVPGSALALTLMFAVTLALALALAIA